MKKRAGKEDVWPVLKSYDKEHLSRIAMPIGGIGTGTVSLGGRGDLRSWEVVNRPSKNFTPPLSFFAVYAKSAGGSSARLLEGPIDNERIEGGFGSPAANHGFPRFRNCSFKAAYPLGQVCLDDPEFPLEARIEAFNPFVPCDADRSGMPVAVFRFVLTNKSSKRVEASVCGSMNNFIGKDGVNGEPKKNVNKFRKGRGISGIYMVSEGVDPEAEQYGTMALATTARTGLSYRTSWKTETRWGADKLDFWDDFSSDGKLENHPGGVDAPQASLTAGFSIPPRSSRDVTFFITWHFPNRLTWHPRLLKNNKPAPGNLIGNYYAGLYGNAWDVAEKTAKQLPALESETVSFVRQFCESSLPHAVKEGALFNLSTLRSQTCFRTPDGRFYAWEGCGDTIGSCFGSCTHVWNYEVATPFLFGDLAKSMRDVEFNHATDKNGRMSFRVFLPLKNGTKYGFAAADGQMGCLMKLYREWQLSGDGAMLRKTWPMAKKALEFCWIKKGWDADCDGVMEGCQHNTMDVEYFGPNPQMQLWYLGALRAAAEMAEYLEDIEFSEKCRSLFERGSKWMDEHLFNGEYYEHEVRTPGSWDKIAEGLYMQKGQDVKKPKFQLGAGCLVDQLVGQYMAHICDLGYLVKPANVKKTLNSIYKYNRKTGFFNHFNSLRSFVLNDENALLMASYPHGKRPEQPFPYFTEVMTGFEYTAAIGMIQEGISAKGLTCIEDIRDRYDGRKRNPFDEAECGHHYGRAMASWAAVVALAGFNYSAVSGRIRFAGKQGVFFWSTGYAWGQCVIKKGSGLFSVTGGKVAFRELEVGGKIVYKAKKQRVLRAGQKITFKV